MVRRLVSPLVAMILACASAAGARAAPCTDPPQVVVDGGDRAAITEICAVAARTMAFLARYGLAPKRTIRLTIVDGPITGQQYDVYGSYDSRTDLLQLMSYRAIVEGMKRPTMYDEPFDRVHYAGAIAHELTHAVVQHNLRTKLLSVAPQEYLAHAAQLAVLPDARREAIIRAMGVEPWQPGDAISDIYMAMQPGRFAVKSYTHLTSTADPLAFVRILLNAKWFYVYVP